MRWISIGKDLMGKCRLFFWEHSQLREMSKREMSKGEISPQEDRILTQGIARTERKYAPQSLLAFIIAVRLLVRVYLNLWLWKSQCWHKLGH